MTKSDVFASRYATLTSEPVSKAARLKLASKPSVTAEWVVFWAFVAGLAWVPFWYGSNVLPAWGINAIIFPGLASIYELSVLLRGESHPVAIRDFKASAALFVAAALWIIIQNATWTPASMHHPIWGMAGLALDRPVEGSISVNRDLTTLALVRLVTSASVLWIAVQLSRNTSRANYLVISLIVISSVYAAYGLIVFALTQSDNPSSRSFVTSTFYNHNHYAAYAGMGLIAVCGFIVRTYRRAMTKLGGSVRYRIAMFLEVTGAKTAALLASAFLIFITVLLTGSRGGVIATLAGLIALGLLTVGGRRQSTVKLGAAILVGGILVVASLLMFGDMFMSQIVEKGLFDDYRMAVQGMTLRSIFAAPLLGYGYGTFADIFPMFRDRSISVQGTWLQAHNTYLEVFQGLGLVFGSMLMASVFLLVLKCFRGATLRQEGGTIPGIATSVAVLVGVHSLVDFSLQIQAVTLTFMALLGAGLAQSRSSSLVVGD
jgi:O-antigen ligase